MKIYLDFMKIVAILFAFSAKVSSGNQPSYQVSLDMQLPIHVCNGVIVHSRLILTTASCAYYKFSSNTPAKPSMLSIISGSSKSNEELVLHVADIFVAKNFNFTTGENDLALLRLNGTLPLDTRRDINWITLEDDKEYDDRCLANFYERNSPNSTPNYIESEQLRLLDYKTCKVASRRIINRDDDICSLYYLPTALNCNELEILQNYNADRGTGLVCGNKLIGLLSTILPLKNITDCKEQPIRAYYTPVVPHISWIYAVIFEEDQKMLNEGEYIASSPYAGESNAFIEPEVTVTDPTFIPVYTTIADEETTVVLSEHNNADAANNKRSYKLLCVIFGIVYLIVLVLGC